MSGRGAELAQSVPEASRGVGNRRLRIAAVDPERGFAGGEVQVIGLIVELMKAGHQVDLMCNPEGGLWARANRSGIACQPLYIRNSLDFAAGIRLRRLLNQRRYDVVHFHTARAHALSPYVRNRARVALVTRRMDYAPNRWFAPWLFNRAVDQVIAISDGVAQALVSAGVVRERITIIPSGVDCDEFAPPGDTMRRDARTALGLLPGDVAIGAVGALVPRKAHDVLIEAMALARDCSLIRTAVPSATRIRCFIAGQGPLFETLNSQIRSHGLQEQVQLSGYVPQPYSLLAALDVFVMPSHYEGLGVAALEAMASGLPLIASAVGGLRELIEPERNGILVDDGDSAALAQAIMRLVRDPELRRRMGAEGRQRAVDKWHMAAMARRTVKLYHACLAKSAG
jgi:glycosyltransferase involved in cell wall biosynthesis